MSLQETHREPRRPVTGKVTFRDLAIKILIESPDTEISDLVTAYLNALRRNPAALASLAEFALQHVKATLQHTNGTTRVRGHQRGRAIKQERKRIVTKTAKEIIQNLMEFKTPYGKATADCTGEELYRLGGWYRVLSKLAGGRTSKLTLRDKGVTEAELKQAVKAA